MATLTTPKYALPYPDGTERVADGDNAIGALALATEGALAKAVTRALRVERRTTGQGTANNVEEIMTFPDMQRDDSTGFLTYAAGLVTVAAAGWILAAAGVNWPANPTGHRQLYIKGGGIVRAGTRDPAPSSGGMPQNIMTMFYAAAGSQVAAYVQQNSGGGSTTVPDERNFLSVMYLG